LSSSFSFAISLVCSLALSFLLFHSLFSPFNNSRLIRFRTTEFASLTSQHANHNDWLFCNSSQRIFIVNGDPKKMRTREIEFHQIWGLERRNPT
jgi:hypothetical protein